MNRTEYTRQVPIKHWLPVPIEYCEGTMRACRVFDTDMVELEEVITGYKQQRAWDLLEKGHRTYITTKMETALHQGQDVEGFQWLDEPVSE